MCFFHYLGKRLGMMANSDGGTPLMFSPSSSVASLTSNEQDYIHNDRSSVASNLR